MDDIWRPAAEGEAVIRVTKSGICNTDIEITRGYAGFEGTIGHEFVGVVEESGRAELVGKRVVGEIMRGAVSVLRAWRGTRAIALSEPCSG